MRLNTRLPMPRCADHGSWSADRDHGAALWLTPGQAGAQQAAPLPWLRAEALTTFKGAALRPAPTQRGSPYLRLLAFRVEDADEVVAVRGVVHCGAVDIAEEGLGFVQGFDFGVELIHGCGVWENGDE